jgi:hypothetical protein
MSKGHTIPVHVSQELRAKLEAEGKAQDRPLSSVVRVLLQEALSMRTSPQRQPGEAA